MDNRGVTQRLDKTVRQSEEGRMMVEAAGDERAWMMATDEDIAVEHEGWLGRLVGGMKVEWHRGHPERRQRDRYRWTEDEWAVYLVDEVAERQYERFAGREVNKSWWVFPRQPPYRVYWRGKRVMGNGSKILKTAMKTERMLGSLALRDGNRRFKDHEEERRAGGDRSRAEKGLRERMVAEARADLERNWYVEGMFESLWKDGNKIGDMVVQVKVVLGILATMGEKRAHRGAEGVCTRCRLCGKSEEEGGETNYHVLWECPGVTGGVKDARRKMVKRIKKGVDTLGLGESRDMMVTALWRLEEGCRSWESVEELALLFEEAAFSREDQARVLEAVRHMEGGSMKKCDRGLVGQNWQQLLVQVGVEEGEAADMVRMMTAETVKGCAGIWRAFMKEVGMTGGDMDGEDWEERRAVLESIGEEHLELVSRATMRKVRRLSEGLMRKWVEEFKSAVEAGEVEQEAAEEVLEQEAAAAMAVVRAAADWAAATAAGCSPGRRSSARRAASRWASTRTCPCRCRARPRGTRPRRPRHAGTRPTPTRAGRRGRSPCPPWPARAQLACTAARRSTRTPPRPAPTCG